METREVDKRGDQKCHRNGKNGKIGIRHEILGKET
jgi:hypothetical protein